VCCNGDTGEGCVRTIPCPRAGSTTPIAFGQSAMAKDGAERGKSLVKTRYSQDWAIVGIDDNTTSPPTKAGTVLHWPSWFLPVIIHRVPHRAPGTIRWSTIEAVMARMKSWLATSSCRVMARRCGPRNDQRRTRTHHARRLPGHRRCRWRSEQWDTR